jgi:membrane protease subunit (stomatin/prohibitin family)
MTPLQVHDKITSYDMMMTSFGAYTYKVVDPVAFFKQAKGAPIVSDKDVLKVIGTKAQNKISGILTYFVTEAGYPFDAISQNIMMSDFENSFLEALNTVPILKDYGIEVNSFSIGGINFTEDGLNKTLSMRTSSKALNEEIGILGQCNWNSIHNREILMAAANNKGVMGGVVNMGLGGMMVGNMLDMMHPDKVNQIPMPGVDRAAGSFDSDASIKEAAKVREKIGALKSDYEAGFIPEEVYDQKLKELQQRLANLY